MSAGQMVCVLVGRLKGKRGEITSIQGGVIYVRLSVGTVTFRACELEVIQ